MVKGEKRELVGQEKPYKKGTIQRCYSIRNQQPEDKKCSELLVSARTTSQNNVARPRFSKGGRACARDLHNTLAQGFTGVIMQMEAAEEALLEANSKQPD